MPFDLLTKAFAKKLNLSESPLNEEELLGKLNADFPALSEIQQAEQNQWITLSKRVDEPTTIDQLNDALKSKTYLITDSAQASLADAAVFSALYATLKEWKEDQVKAHRHIIRWADLIQNIGLFDLAAADKIAVNYNLEVPREIKEKPKKDDKKDAGKDTKAAAKGGKEAAKDAKKDAPKDEAPKFKGKPDPETLAALKAAKEKKKKEKKPQAQAQPEAVVPNPGMIDFRVGHIQKAIKHPDADSLYVSTIDMGDAEGPRTVCSGLAGIIPLEDMQDRYVVCVANLKPVTMRGIKSCAMVLCASRENDDPHSKEVEFVNPPKGAKAGEKIFFETYDQVPEKQLNPKKKIWEACQAGFTTNENKEVIYKKEGEPDRKLIVKDGQVLSCNNFVGACVR